MESINMALIVHCVNDPEQNFLVDQQWEVSNPILSCSNLQNLPFFFLSNPGELTIRFYVWELGLPFALSPKCFIFLNQQSSVLSIFPMTQIQLLQNNYLKLWLLHLDKA